MPKYRREYIDAKVQKRIYCSRSTEATTLKLKYRSDYIEAKIQKRIYTRGNI